MSSVEYRPGSGVEQIERGEIFDIVADINVDLPPSLTQKEIEKYYVEQITTFVAEHVLGWQELPYTRFEGRLQSGELTINGVPMLQTCRNAAQMIQDKYTRAELRGMESIIRDLRPGGTICYVSPARGEYGAITHSVVIILSVDLQNQVEQRVYLAPDTVGNFQLARTIGNTINHDWTQFSSPGDFIANPAIISSTDIEAIEAVLGIDRQTIERSETLEKLLRKETTHLTTQYAKIIMELRALDLYLHNQRYNLLLQMADEVLNQVMIQAEMIRAHADLLLQDSASFSKALDGLANPRVIGVPKILASSCATSSRVDTPVLRDIHNNIIRTNESDKSIKQLKGYMLELKIQEMMALGAEPERMTCPCCSVRTRYGWNTRQEVLTIRGEILCMNCGAFAMHECV